MAVITQQEREDLSLELERLAGLIREKGLLSLPPKQVTLLCAAVKLGGVDTPVFRKPLRKGFHPHPASLN
jgi:hypothetical protein